MTRYTKKLGHVTLRFQARVVYIKQPKPYNSSNSKVIYKKVNKQIAYFGDLEILICEHGSLFEGLIGFYAQVCLAVTIQLFLSREKMPIQKNKKRSQLEGRVRK